MFWSVTQTLLSGFATTFEIFIFTLIFDPRNTSDVTAYHYLLRTGYVVETQYLERK